MELSDITQRGLIWTTVSNTQVGLIWRENEDTVLQGSLNNGI